MLITEAIRKLIASKAVLFTTPGHSGGKGILPEYQKFVGKMFYKIDLSENQGLDNLSNPQSSIKYSLTRATNIYNSKQTFYLINGSTSGIIALFLALINPGDKVLAARNVHKSIVNAMLLSGAYPVWVNPQWEDNWNIPAYIKPETIEQILDANPDIKLLIITNPTYEGIISDVEKIAKICKKKNVFFIVDEAHGALWNFSQKLPDIAIHLGADACVQSLHKTGSCLTQGSLLHISKNSSINPDNVQKTLNIINTTSPSYPILSSIENSIEYLHSDMGRRKIDKLFDNIEEIKNFLKININANFISSTDEYLHDPTKFFIGLNNTSGDYLAEILQNNFNLEVELSNNKGLLALIGVGTTRKKLQKLAFTLVKAFNTSKQQNLSDVCYEDYYKSFVQPFLFPKTVYSPSEVFYKKSKKVLLSESIGLVSKETIVNYPPGIPLLIAGEEITSAHIEVLSDFDEIETVE